MKRDSFDVGNWPIHGNHKADVIDARLHSFIFTVSHPALFSFPFSEVIPFLASQ